MRDLKRIISLLLLLAMLCGMMPMTVFATEETEVNPWSGRSAVFVGDSITAGSGTTKIYYSFLEEALGFGTVTAMGVGGSCISAASDYGTGNQPLINRYQNIPSTDLIVIFMGTNDYGHETPLGSVGDTKDGTFYGALNTIIPALVAKHTSSKIVFVTPLHRYGFGTSKILGTKFTYDNIPNGVGATLGDYVDALKTVCSNNGVSVIDLHTECTLEPSDAAVRATYMPDGLHPNASGHKVIAGILESHLRTYEPVESKPVVLPEMIQGNKFASGNDQPCRASSRINYYLKAGTVITLKNPDAMQWACARTSNESSSNNLGYFPDSQWTDKETAVVAEDGWVGFVFKYRDETKWFDLTKPLSDYITIEVPHTHEYASEITAPTCTQQGYTTYTCQCGDRYVTDYVAATGEHIYKNGVCSGCGDSVLGSDWIVPEFAEGDYSMVVLPDTQNMVDYWPEAYYAQMQWIADSKDALNIQAVMNMGDLVNTNNDTQWKVYKNGTEILQRAGIPWMPMRGNHDDSTWFNKYYDYSTYGSGQSWFGGSYQTGKLDHTYWFVTAGDREYMILSLGWAPSWDVLTWAQGIMEAYPEKNVILNCHAYMNDDGTLLSKGDAHCVSSVLPNYPNGDDVWAAFKEYENIVLAMGGHIHSADIVTYMDKNGTGRNVASLLIDRQYDDVDDRLGMVAVLTFHTDSDTMDINWYSTRYDAMYREKNQFSVSVPHICDHQYTSAITEPTCTVGGGTKYTCTLCGHSYVDAVSDPLGHDYDAVVTAPGCTNEGYTTLTCSVCGHSERQKTIVDITEQLAWAEGYRITATNGQQVADSGWVASDYLDISAYENIEIKTANTASKDSNAGLAFYDANKNYISGVIHTDKSGIYGTLIRNLEIPENAVYVRSTWYSKNHTGYDPTFGEPYCKATVSTIPALGHAYGTETVAPTCTTPGYIAEVCSVCGHLERKTIVIDITDQFEWISGWMIIATTGACTDYPYWQVSDYLDISAYQSIEIKTANTASKDSNAGLAFYDFNKNYISGVIHTDQSGVYGTLIRDIEIPENAVYVRTTWYTKDHSGYDPAFGEPYCKATTTEIPPVAHDYETAVTAPSCTQQGYTTYTCNCGESYVDDYVETVGHTYKNGICTICGAEHPNLANYEGKVFSILGDSISTFAGYIPVADGFNLAHRPRYPQSNLLTDVNETWWMQAITQLDAKLGINDSWAGSRVINTMTGNSGDQGENAAMASLTRIQNLGANGTPDVILFYGGTNDIGHKTALGRFDPTNAPTEVDLTSTKWSTAADAYVAAILRMQYYYPNAQIIAMLPTYTTSYYTEANLEQYNAVYAAICEHYGVTYIDLRDCGITTADLPDGIHPDANGMDYITEAVLKALLDECDMTEGENVVHTVTHNLTGAESSLGYYRGVSHGKAFVTTITGENVTVTVTMGGVDITASVYAESVVRIPKVTGDVVITAQGREKSVYEDYLQQLPNNLCKGINLWTALKPENIYYTSTGWGNLSGNQAWSITIPVNAGDQIWANSFQAYGDNGNTYSTNNGIRVTWFDENGVMYAMIPETTYAEFAAKGYITVPDGAVAVNIPMWSNSGNNEVYILNRDHNYKNGICTGCGVAQWDTDGDGVLEILAIGNSFSVDALEYAYQIAQDLGIEEIVIGNLYIGGCSLNTHATNAAGDLAKYTYYYNDNGTRTSTKSHKISTALESRSWDYVSMQQASNYSGVESTYNEDLTNLIDYVQARSDAKLVWHMTWAYQQDSTHSAFPTYGKNQMTMYNAIVSAVQNKIVTNSNFDLIVPNGTAVQNSRTSLLGDTTTRDGYHLSYDYGRYLAGLLFIKTVTGLSVDNITYAPSGVDAERMAIAIESVNNAATKPFAVTQSAHVEEEPEIPEEGYILLQSELYKGAFWHPLKEDRYNELITDMSNSHQFFATIRFTRETLPVGSIIVLSDGWQYRPDGWITDALQTGTRETVTTESYVVITEEWWGDYTIRSFNISKVGLPSLTNVTEEEVRTAFRIYVPEEKHIHVNDSVITEPTCTEKGYTAHTCTLCGNSSVDSYTEATGHNFVNDICSACGELNYVLLQPELYPLAYWNSNDRNGNHSTLITDAHNSHQYFATIRFTRETLPVGSVIVLADGWQYRPEGWVTDTVHTTRPDTTTASRVVVTEEWWGDYTLRAFNISKVGLPSLSGMTDAAVSEAFRIYIPASLAVHTHTYTPAVTAPTCAEKGYTTYTCVCGDSYVSDYVDATGVHIYENGVCACGATQELTDASLIFYRAKTTDPYGNFKLTGEIIAYLTAKKQAACEDYYVVFSYTYLDNVVTFEATPSSSSNEYYAQFDCPVPAALMTTDIQATVYGVKDGVAYKGETITFTVRECVDAKLNTWINNYGTNDKQTKLFDTLVNMLAYGAQAQIRFTINTDNLATDGLPENYAAKIKTDVLTLNTFTDPDTTGQKSTLANMGLILKEKFNMYGNFKIVSGNTNMKDYMVKIVHTKADGSTESYELTDLQLKNNVYVYFEFNKIAPAQMFDQLQITLYMNGVPVSATYIRSGENIVASFNDQLKNLGNAAMQYSVCAKEAFS